MRTVPHTEEEKRRGKKSEWTEGGDLYIAEDEVSDGSGQESGNGSSSTTPSGGNTDVGWRKEGDTWCIRQQVFRWKLSKERLASLEWKVVSL